jgi:hypothetical protein
MILYCPGGGPSEKSNSGFPGKIPFGNISPCDKLTTQSDQDAA